MAIKPGKQSKVPKQARKNLPQIKRNIEGASTYFKENVVHYNELMNFIYNTTVNQTDKDALHAMDKPVIEFNIVEAFISRLLGEFAKQEPSAEVRGCNDSVSPQLVEFIESFMRGFLKDAKSRQTLYNVYKSCLGGGYGIFKIYTEYEHNKSFDQVIKVKAHPHPTRVFFDPDAKNPSKDDGKYCFESYVKTKEEVEEMAPNIDLSKIDYYPDIEGVQWYFADKDEKKHIVVFDYYEKKRVKRTAHLLADGSVMNSAEFTKYKAEFSGIEQPLESKETRTYYDTIIVRYRLIGDEVISYEETDYDYFPLIFVDGQSAYVQDKLNGVYRQLTRSYVYNAVDAQRLKNLLGSAITNEIENMRQAQWLVDLEAIPPAFLKQWENPQITQLLAYNSLAADGRALNPPTAVPRQPLDTAMLGAFSQIDRTIQTTFGSYDAALGINNQQLSGKAIVAGSQNSNSASMPYVTNFMAGLNHLLNVVLALLPKYYNTPRTVPVIERDGSRGYRYINPPMGQISAAQMPQFSVVAEQDFSKPINVDYDPSGLEVCVKAGVNFEIQKQEALTTLTSLMPSLPSLSQILNTDGLPIVLDNLDIRGADQLKQLADEFMEQQRQAQAQGAQQPTPEQIQMQIKMQEMQQNQQKMELEAQNNQAQNAIALGQLNLERDKLNMQRESAQSASAVQLAKAATEREVQASKFALASEDQAHQHAMDFGKMAQSRGDTHAKEESSIDESNESA